MGTGASGKPGNRVRELAALGSVREKGNAITRCTKKSLPLTYNTTITYQTQNHTFDNAQNNFGLSPESQ